MKVEEEEERKEKDDNGISAGEKRKVRRELRKWRRKGEGSLIYKNRKREFKKFS